MRGTEAGRTRLERERRQRRAWVIGLGISAAAHVALFAWGGLPITLLEPAADRQAMSPDREEARTDRYLRAVQIRPAETVRQADAAAGARPSREGGRDTAAESGGTPAATPDASKLALAGAPRPARGPQGPGADAELHLASVVPLPEVRLPVTVPQRGVVQRDAPIAWVRSDGARPEESAGDERRRRGGGGIGITIRGGGAGCDTPAAAIFDRVGPRGLRGGGIRGTRW